MAAYRIQRILWATHFAPARKIHGNPGPVYYPSIFLPGTYELPSANRPQVEYRSKDGKKTKVFDALEKYLKREDGLLISKIYYFQPILANCRVDITIFILYMGLYWTEPVGAWCRINSGPICCYSFLAVTQPCQP